MGQGRGKKGAAADAGVVSGSRWEQAQALRRRGALQRGSGRERERGTMRLGDSRAAGKRACVDLGVGGSQKRLGPEDESGARLGGWGR